MKTTTVNAVRERPIPFTAESVRAILAGTKTQTRRVIKQALDLDGPAASIHPDGSGLGWIAWWPNPVTAEETKRLYPGDEGFHCPYGVVGDRLWSKETWCPRANGMLAIEKIQRPFYRADGDVPRNQIPHGWKWRSGRFMPRWASRLTLEITDVRVQRVTEISEENAEAEGAIGVRDNLWGWENWNGGPFESARDAFAWLWDSINGHRPGCAWKDSPWVWAISFRPLAPCDARTAARARAKDEAAGEAEVRT